jgi:hypothetical protein
MATAEDADVVAASQPTMPNRAQLANQLYREFRTLCFWHSPPELIITEEMIPFVLKGLRANGGWKGFMLAEHLEKTREPSSREGTVRCR